MCENLAREKIMQLAELLVDLWLNSAQHKYIMQSDDMVCEHSLNTGRHPSDDDPIRLRKHSLLRRSFLQSVCV
ncbi:hypothetical protein XELAEV_18041332mg [Xenopus laevis]|uniref:Uncharacterized protein n=1 Tax=Xenopus laevis TaxID=8355 RepID=A0A974H5B7_XENLA|nr:hypothetical protein XELAEV_18041332mg [Xenopus laevis]